MVSVFNVLNATRSFTSIIPLLNVARPILVVSHSIFLVSCSHQYQSIGSPKILTQKLENHGDQPARSEKSIKALYPTTVCKLLVPGRSFRRRQRPYKSGRRLSSRRSTSCAPHLLSDTACTAGCRLSFFSLRLLISKALKGTLT
jgi:hypothetical protein